MEEKIKEIFEKYNAGLKLYETDKDTWGKDWQIHNQAKRRFNADIPFFHTETDKQYIDDLLTGCKVKDFEPEVIDYIISNGSSQAKCIVHAYAPDSMSESKYYIDYYFSWIENCELKSLFCRFDVWQKD